MLPESKCDKYRWTVRVQRGHVYIQSEALKAPMDAKNRKTEKICFCIVTKVDPFEKNRGVRFWLKQVRKRLQSTGATNVL